MTQETPRDSNIREYDLDTLIRGAQRQWYANALQTALIILVIAVCCHYVSLLDGARLSEGTPSIIELLLESVPPDFRDAGAWIRPILDRLAMSIAGTALAVFVSLPLSILAARPTSPHPIVYQSSRWVLNALRSIPELIMGIIFVAAANAAQGILLGLSKANGILHIGGLERISRFDFGKLLRDIVGVPNAKLYACTRQSIAIAAPRPADVSLSSARAMALGFKPGSLRKELERLVCTKIEKLQPSS